MALVQELPEGTVTVLFTDVVGSTELTNRLGDERAREVLGAGDDLVRGQIERHRGREVKGTGDGLMVAFTSARRAVSCAVDIQRAIAEHNSHGGDAAISVRIGLNTGEVVREEEDLFGVTVNAAARIAAEGDAGDILISEGVKIVLGTATTAELEDEGETGLKGFDEPWRLYSVKWQQATGPGATLDAARTPYVGRKDERAQLRRLLEQAESGQGSLVMIGGEPGVGKTRIAEELLAEAEAKGFLTLVGHSYDMEGAPPYLPFVEIMQAAVKSVSPEALRTALGDEAPEVAKVMPELRRLFPDIAAPLELPPEQERHYLFNSLRAFTARASEAQPIVMLLDDLHWADDSTLLLVQHYAQQLSSMSVLIVATYRDVELDVGRPLAKALEDLLRQRLAHRIALRRLPLEDVAGMLRAASGQDPPQELVDVVFSETEGNPFFVEEVFQHFREEGKLFDESGKWRPDLVVGDLDVPEGVRLVIGRRLQHVSDQTRHVLTNAAVIGRVFSFDLLEALSAESADALLDAVDEAEEAHLVAPVDAEGREARYMFSHELIRQTLISNLSLPRRQRLHLQIADAMEVVHEHDIEARAEDIAHHLYQAGAAADVDKTVHYLALAGEKALTAAAFEDAHHLLDEAVGLRPNASDIVQADLLYRRGMAHRSIGRWEEARNDWSSSLSLYEERDDGEAAARVCRELSMLFIWAADWEGALEVAQRGLRAVPESSPALRGELLAQSGLLRSLSGDYDGADHEIEEAIELAHELNDTELLGDALGSKVMHHQWHLQAAEVVEIGTEAIELQMNAGNIWNAVDTMWATQYALSFLLRINESRRMGERAIEIAERIGHWGGVFSARRGLIGVDFLADQDVDAFEEAWKADLEMSLRLESPWVSNSYSNLARINFWRGKWDESLEQARQAAQLEPPGITEGFDWSVLFLILSYMGRRDEALDLLENKRATLPNADVVPLLGSWYALQGVIEGLAVLREEAACAELYSSVQDLVAQGMVWSWGFSFVQTSAGICATEAQQYDQALDHFKRALADCDEQGFTMGTNEVHYWYARMLLRRDAPGDADKARAFIDDAIAGYTNFGMPKHAELARALL